MLTITKHKNKMNGVNVDNNLINDDDNTQIEREREIEREIERETETESKLLNYTKLDLLFNYLINEEEEFEKLTEIDKEIIIRNLKRLEIYATTTEYMPNKMILDLKIQYWAIMELYLSPYKIYLDKIKREDFLFRFLKTKQYIDISTGTDEDLQHFVGYFIKSLQNKLENKEVKK